MSMISRNGITALLSPLIFAVLVSGCASLPPGSDFPKEASTALAHPEQTKLGKHYDDAAAAHDGNSGFRMISAGVDGFLTRMEMIDAAERTLDLQYYIFHADDTGLLMTNAVLKAADRGVRVRLMIDDGETISGDEAINALNAHPNIQIRVFNPFAYRGHAILLRAIEFALDFERLDYRMHNKLLAADNAMALLGGRNIGDQYFQIDPGSQFADDDVIAGGPIVRELSATFDEYWNSALAIPSEALDAKKWPAAALDAYRARLKEHMLAMKSNKADYVQRLASGEPFASVLTGRLPMIWAHAVVVCDSPDKSKVEKRNENGRLIGKPVAEAVNAAQSELLIVTPFFIPGKMGLAMLATLRQRGVRLRVLTNSLESNPEILAHSGYMTYRLPMLRDGAELFETRSLLGNAKGSGESKAMSSHGNFGLHAKLYVFDRSKVFIGSMNFDQRSAHLNTELGLLIDSPELASQVSNRFEAMTQLENSYTVELSLNPDDVVPHLVWRTREAGMEKVYDIEPARNGRQRALANILKLLPLDGEL